MKPDMMDPSGVGLPADMIWNGCKSWHEQCSIHNICIYIYIICIYIYIHIIYMCVYIYIYVYNYIHIICLYIVSKKHTTQIPVGMARAMTPN